MRFIIILLCIAAGFSISFAKEKLNCVMVYYGNKEIPMDILRAYDMVITSENAKFVKEIRMLFYEKHLPKFIGYLSIGELDSGNPFYSELKQFAIGKNKMWGSKILNVTNKQYQDFIINKEARYIVDQGFDGFFLDTLNSYKLVVPQKDWKPYQDAIINIVKALKQKYPDKMIIVNRGFSVFNEIKPYINGVLVESLFKGIDNHKNYIDVPSTTTEKLLKILTHIKDSGIPVIVLDYAKDQKEAKKDIKKIASYGFIPYVSDYNLDKVGYSMCSPVRRNIVLLYTKGQNNIRQNSFISTTIWPILEYLGYVPFVYEANRERLPSLTNTGFRAIINHYLKVKHTNYLEDYLSKALEKHVKLFFISKIPVDKESFLDELGIEKEKNRASRLSNFDVLYKAPGDGYEAPLVLEYSHHLYRAKGDILVKARNEDGKTFTPFVLTKWGGFALNGSLVNFNGLFVYDPFKIFKKILKPDFPAMDYTTENGARILIAFVDGDDFPGRSEVDTQKTTGQILYDRILTDKKYGIPISISLIAGDISSHGRYPDRSEELKAIAKKIFRLPNVEPASHTFSHPYHWRKVLKTPNAPKMRIMIPGYTYNQTYEITGSVKILNKLTPPGKPVNLLQWSGNADPDKKALLTTYKAKIYNINGGNTVIDNKRNFLKYINGSGVNFGEYFYQVYAPIQNDFIYTHGMRVPWGFLKVIQAFKLTDKPRRLKPLTIYYHFYAANTVASLNALKKVYDYALAQKPIPIFPYQYDKIVLDARETAIIRIKHGFIIKNNGYARTIRVPLSWGYPDLEKSEGVVGYSTINSSRYIYLDGSGDYKVIFTDKPQNVYLVYANGIVENFKRNNDIMSITFKSYIPLIAKIKAHYCESPDAKVYHENDTWIIKGSKDFTGYETSKVVCK